MQNTKLTVPSFRRAGLLQASVLVAGRNRLRGFYTSELSGPGCEAQNGFSCHLWSGDHRVHIPTLQI